MHSAENGSEEPTVSNAANCINGSFRQKLDFRYGREMAWRAALRGTFNLMSKSGERSLRNALRCVGSGMVRSKSSKLGRLLQDLSKMSEADLHFQAVNDDPAHAVM